MAVLIKMSELYVPTLKEDPVDAELPSHRLLLRAGMIRKSAAGLYSYLPLGWRSLYKIENIVREEMDAAGAQEMRMSIMQPAELWHESGRWDDYGPELMRLRDRHEREFCLGPTHEELITSIVRGELRSYKQLPLNLYQIQTKFRDEVRPRFGLMRAREFVMKDAYSFHDSAQSLQQTYEIMGTAYGRICDRLGLAYYAVEADPGQIGGSITEEFMALAENGEAEIAHCECGYAGDTEVAEAVIVRPERTEEELRLVSTPGTSSIADVAALLGVSEAEVVKAIPYADSDGQRYLFLLPGDHELNEIKVENIFSMPRMLSGDEAAKAGLVPGFMGPVGAPDGFKIIADSSLINEVNWIVGANQVDAHYVGALADRDFKVDGYEDIVQAQEGDLCPRCGKPLSIARGIEVGQIFQLGDKYSRSMGATFLDEEGEERHFLMGCYGVGVSRALAAVIEQHNDEAGIVWPVSVAPVEVEILPLGTESEVTGVAHDLARELSDAGIEILLDDRDERPGVKFADADLIGLPYQIIVGKKGLAQKQLELKDRATGERSYVDLETATETIQALVEEKREPFKR